MPYEFLEDIAPADVAFKVWDTTIEGLFASAADAMMEIMVDDLKTISRQENKEIRVESDAIDLLLFNFLQELIFYKDAEQLVLRPVSIFISRDSDIFHLVAMVAGERINPQKHELKVDVKAVTLHKFYVEKTAHGWESFILIDV